MPPKKGRSLGVSPLARQVARKAYEAAMAAPAHLAADAAAAAEEAALSGKIIRRNALQTGNLGLRLQMGANIGLPSAFNTNTTPFNFNELNAEKAPNLSKNAGSRAYAAGMIASAPRAEENILVATTPSRAAGGGGGGMATYQYRISLPSVGGPRGVGPYGALSPGLMSSGQAAFNPNNLMNFGGDEGGGGGGASRGGRRRRKTRRSRKYKH